MTRSDRKRLDDILAVADEIASIVARGKTAWTEMIRLRDRLSHHYHRVEADRRLVTADTDVPNR